MSQSKQSENELLAARQLLWNFQKAVHKTTSTSNFVTKWIVPRGEDGENPQLICCRMKRNIGETDELSTFSPHPMGNAN